MRNFLLAFLNPYLLLGLPLAGLAQTGQTGQTGSPAAPLETVATARAGQAQGKLVFYYTLPVAAYDVAFTFDTRLQPSEAMTVNSIVGQCLTAALTEAGAQLKPFDAILIQAGQRELAIRFRADVPEAQRALATVPRNQGKLIYLFCEPVASYQVVSTEGVSWYNHAFGGAYYSVGRVQENLLRTARKNPSIDGIVIGETATYINFTK